ncbi:hypothetical protein M970_021220 [Encephalitozoon cuniculi EcunIII-L]|uniref:Uncharacterized protein n=1 Tax=Encephalitozoon cuniculi TaxID=6035 RepID=M1K8G9_ENCCN|nr:hypothetical protein ECU02_1260 [Encephalitozoon cuniculi]KMV66644.1 hypothetical protein M970_021220 [Encephalitozoon cuniculi EcunIII-L]UYI28319.1 hypothetical protein J0A71_10g22250 [Encephalitozoon cuniculi]
MIIRIDRKYVTSAIKEWFEHLKSLDDVLEEDEEARDDLATNYKIEVKENGKKDMASISIDEFDIKHDVSLDNIEETLVEVVGSLLGYRSTVIHGFTVKDLSGRKMKPVVRIFFRPALGIQVPKKLEYVKNVTGDTPEIDEGMMVRSVSISPIVRSLLNSGSLRFSAEGTRILLTLYNGTMSMVSDTIEVFPMVHSTLSRKNMNLFLRLLRSFSFKFVETFIKAYQMPSSLEVNKELSRCFSELQNTLTKLHVKCIHKIVSNAPVFLDARDKITERIEKFYIYNAKGFKRKKTQYLRCREELHIDRSPIGSLKRYFRGVSKSPL